MVPVLKKGHQMSEDATLLKSQCRSCSKSTRHDLLFTHMVETDPDGYHEADSWQVVRCRGCYTVGFRHQNDDFEIVSEDSEGNVVHDVTIITYPRVYRNHRKLSGTWWLPELIRKVYNQTLSAYGESAYVLASIGLRATIEAVCNHLQISGATLEKRIDQLFKGGFVSNADKKRLHAIRFLGNDAAHEVKEPGASELRVALEIVEHLLNSVFILSHKARSLKTIIESYEEFLDLVGRCVTEADSSRTVSLGAILAGNRRLVGNNIDIFEGQLKADIAAGKIPYLALAQVETVNGKDVQLYGVADGNDFEVLD